MAKKGFDVTGCNSGSGLERLDFKSRPVTRRRKEAKPNGLDELWKPNGDKLGSMLFCTFKFNSNSNSVLASCS